MKRLYSFPVLLGSMLAFGCVVVSDDDDTGAATDSASASASASASDSASASASASDSASASASDSDSDSASASASDSASDSATDSAGTDTTDTGADAMFCAEECQEDSDCEVAGNDAGFTCTDNRCVGDAIAGCTTNEECVAQLSGWSTGTECAAQAECDAAGQFCIDVNGTNRCVAGPSMALTCETLMQQDIELMNVDGDTVTVCGQPDAECNDFGGCFVPCASDDDCASDAFPVCDTATGVCGCGSDADCETLGNAATSVCLDTGTCGCSEDQDCVDAGSGDTCFNGGCGCSGDAACEGITTSFDNTTVICAGL